MLKKIKIIFSGGGTGGSVTPLLAMKDIIRNDSQYGNAEFVWVGTKKGAEHKLVKFSGLRFVPILSGKLRRYWSFQNLFDLLIIIVAFFQSFFLLAKEKPDLVISAGSYVSAPLVWAAWLKRVPVLIQQLDIRPGLANRLMAPFAQKILVTFEKSLKDYGRKAVLYGNPVRMEFRKVKVSRREAIKKIGFNVNRPVLLIIGGGTGATAINDLILENINKISDLCQVLHITGIGKSGIENTMLMQTNANYRFFEFLDTFGVIKAYASADAIVSRAGMASLTELCFLGKPSIIIPMPDTHQEENASVFAKSEAAIVLDQKNLNSEILIKSIKTVLSDLPMKEKLKKNIKKIINTDCDDVLSRQLHTILKK